MIWHSRLQNHASLRHRPQRSSWSWHPPLPHVSHAVGAIAEAARAHGLTRGSATASVRTLLEESSATGASTAAPPTERRDPLPWRTRARPLQLSRNPPKQLTLRLQGCASASLLYQPRAIKRRWQTRGSATSPQWRSARRRRWWPTSSAARRVPAVVQRQTNFSPNACSAWETRPQPRVPLAPRFGRRVRRAIARTSSDLWLRAATWRTRRGRDGQRGEGEP